MANVVNYQYVLCLPREVVFTECGLGMSECLVSMMSKGTAGYCRVGTLAPSVSLGDFPSIYIKAGTAAVMQLQFLGSC